MEVAIPFPGVVRVDSHSNGFRPKSTMWMRTTLCAVKRFLIQNFAGVTGKHEQHG
jgi:hypothetical protein